MVRLRIIADGEAAATALRAFVAEHPDLFTLLQESSTCPVCSAEMVWSPVLQADVCSHVDEQNAVPS